MMYRQNPEPRSEPDQGDLHRLSVEEQTEPWRAAREAQERKRQIRHEFLELFMILAGSTILTWSVYHAFFG